MLKKIFSILIMILLLVGLRGNVFAKDTYTATSTINGVTVNWEYEVNETNQIENLKCTNPTALIGNITIPSTLDGKTVIAIGNSAFKEAINITGIIMPDSVEKIGINAFKDCTKLSSVNLGKVKEFAGNGIFANCTSLKNIVIPKTLTKGYIYLEGAFSGCTSLISVTFEDGITKIPEGILMDATTIAKITIPSSVTEIGSHAFARSGLTEITIPNKVTKIGISAFEETKLVEIQIPSSVKHIGVSAFKNCSKLVKVTILDNVEKMGYYDTPTDNNDVFTNNNSDLTIYCYENSDAAKYAIINNIKYVYLTKPTTDSDTDKKDEQDQQQKPSDTPSTNQEPTKKDDTTITTGKLPQTGAMMTGLFIILIISISSTTFYIKYRKFRDIK